MPKLESLVQKLRAQWGSLMKSLGISTINSLGISLWLSLGGALWLSLTDELEEQCGI